jgi:hypothetical protein
MQRSCVFKFYFCRHKFVAQKRRINRKEVKVKKKQKKAQQV